MKAAESTRVAESRGYAKGYQAGRRKASRDGAATLWLRVFEISLPHFGSPDFHVDSFIAGYSLKTD